MFVLDIIDYRGMNNNAQNPIINRRKRFVVQTEKKKVYKSKTIVVVVDVCCFIAIFRMQLTS